MACSSAWRRTAAAQPAELLVLRALNGLGFPLVVLPVPSLFALAVHEATNEHTVSTTVGWTQQCSSTGQVLCPPLVAWVAGVAGGWQWPWVITGEPNVLSACA